MKSNPILADPRLVMLGPESSWDEYDDTMRGSDSQPTTTNQYHHQQCMVSTINYSSYHNSLSVALSCNLSVSVAYCSWLGMSLAWLKLGFNAVLALIFGCRKFQKSLLSKASDCQINVSCNHVNSWFVASALWLFSTQSISMLARFEPFCGPSIQFDLHASSD